MEDILLTDRTQALTYKYWSEYLQKIYQESGSPLAQEISFETTDATEEKFWIPIRRYIKDKDQAVGTGELLCSIRIMPKA